MLFFSVGEWQKLMKESSVFIFYGTQKCLNYVRPSLLVSFPLQGKNRYTMRTCICIKLLLFVIVVVLYDLFRFIGTIPVTFFC